MEYKKENLISATKPENLNTKSVEIIIETNPILRQICEAVENPKSPEIKELLEKMKVALSENNGIGLAANQIGANQRVFIVQTEKKQPLRVFINPEVIRTSGPDIPMEEGCLSVPGKIAVVIRPERIMIEAVDERGIKRLVKAKDLFARVIQHELDHLDGIIYTDKAVPGSIRVAEKEIKTK